MTGSTEISVLAAAGNEGGGAAIGQVIGMTAVAVVIGALLCWLGYLHRTRKITWVNSVAEYAGRKFKRPPWVARAAGAVHRDAHLRAVRLHLGRQPAHRQGPRPRAAGQPRALLHPGRLVPALRRGLRGDHAALREARPVRRSDHQALVRAGQRLPDGRLRPVRTDRLPARRRLAPHLRPGRHAVGADPPDDDRRRRVRRRSLRCSSSTRATGRWATTSPRTASFLKGVKYLGFGGIIIGLSVFQIEFDFGVPQFRQVFEPMLIAAAGAFGLVAARMMLGRVRRDTSPPLFAIALRGLVALVVGPVLGAPINWFALYLGAAIVVELLALTPVFKRPIVFGLVSGLLVSTVGLWLESFWIDAVYHYPWPSSIWPEALDDGRAGRRPHRCVRRDARHGAHRSTAAGPRHRHRAGRADRRWSSAARPPTDCATRCRRTPPPR